MVTAPLVTPLAMPLAVIETQLVSEEPHWTEAVTSLLLPSENAPNAENCCVAAGEIDAVPGKTRSPVNVAGAGVGVGEGEGLGVGVGVGTKPLCAAPPPPPQPFKRTRLNKTIAARIVLTFTLASEPNTGLPVRNFFGEKRGNCSVVGPIGQSLYMYCRACTIGYFKLLSYLLSTEIFRFSNANESSGFAACPCPA